MTSYRVLERRRVDPSTIDPIIDAWTADEELNELGFVGFYVHREFCDKEQIWNPVKEGDTSSLYQDEPTPRQRAPKRL